MTVRRAGFGVIDPEYSAGIYVDRLKGTNVTTPDNAGYGVLGGTSVKLTALTAIGNGKAGSPPGTKASCATRSSRETTGTSAGST